LFVKGQRERFSYFTEKESVEAGISKSIVEGRLLSAHGALREGMFKLKRKNTLRGSRTHVRDIKKCVTSLTFDE
jgi:hypothetical protein